MLSTPFYFFLLFFNFISNIYILAFKKETISLYPLLHQAREDKTAQEVLPSGGKKIQENLSVEGKILLQLIAECACVPHQTCYLPTQPLQANTNPEA